MGFMVLAAWVFSKKSAGGFWWFHEGFLATCSKAARQAILDTAAPTKKALLRGVSSLLRSGSKLMGSEHSEVGLSPFEVVKSSLVFFWGVGLLPSITCFDVRYFCWIYLDVCFFGCLGVKMFGWYRQCRRCLPLGACYKVGVHKGPGLVFKYKEQPAARWVPFGAKFSAIGTTKPSSLWKDIILDISWRNKKEKNKKKKYWRGLKSWTGR